MKHHAYDCEGQIGGECSCNALEELCPACQPCPYCGRENLDIPVGSRRRGVREFIRYLVEVYEAEIISEEILYEAYAAYEKTAADGQGKPGEKR